MEQTALLVLDMLSSDDREDDHEDDSHDDGGQGDCVLYRHFLGHGYVQNVGDRLSMCEQGAHDRVNDHDHDHVRDGHARKQRFRPD